MLSFCSSQMRKNKATQEALGGVGYVLYLDCGDGVRGLCLCETYQTVHIKLV